MKKIFFRLLNLFSYLSFCFYFFVFIFVILYLVFKSNFPFFMDSVFKDASPLKAVLFQEPVFEGLFPAIWGTLMLVFFSVAIAVPAGIGTGIWLSEYSGKRLYSIMTVFLDILSGLPSIVIGLFGFSLILFFHSLFPEKSPGFSILVSSSALAFLILPYLARSTETAVSSIDRTLRMAGPALGASKIENIRLVLIPCAFPSIFSGILLAIARCAEDTAVIMLTGAVASAGIPRSIFERFEALPFYIYYTSSEYTSAEELLRAFDASVILILICSMLFVISFILNKAVLKRGK